MAKDARNNPPNGGHMQHYYFANFSLNREAGLWELKGSDRLYLHKPNEANKWYVAQLMPNVSKEHVKRGSFVLKNIMGPFRNPSEAFDSLHYFALDYAKCVGWDVNTKFGHKLI